MTPRRKKRLYFVSFILVGVAIAAALGLNAFNENIMFFHAPTAVVKGEAPHNHAFRLGGLVADGSVRRQPDGLTVLFDVTDNEETVTIQYTGILPDLFREGQGIVANGKLREDGVFVADEVLAKHDENYMPPEVAESLKTAHQEGVEKAAETAAAQ